MLARRALKWGERSVKTSRRHEMAEAEFTSYYDFR